MNVKTTVSAKPCTRSHVPSGVSAANVKMMIMMIIKIKKMREKNKLASLQAKLVRNYDPVCQGQG